MIVETLAAAASCWAIYDRSLSGGLVLGCERLGERVVAGWKCHSTEEGRTVTLHRLASPPRLGAFPRGGALGAHSRLSALVQLGPGF